MPEKKRNYHENGLAYAAKLITREDVERAMRQTISNRAAAVYLRTSYIHYKKYAKMYFAEDGISLFEKHKNRSGRGIPKHLKNGEGLKFNLIDIIEGRVSAASFQVERIKGRLISEGYLRDECCLCAFKERRIVDYKVPLIIHFKD